MSLEYAAHHLSAAVCSLATSERPLQDRLQSSWDDHVQMVWMKPCLTRDLLREFRDLWQRYTAASDDPMATRLRSLSDDEFVRVAEELLSLATRTSVVGATAPPGEKLAKLADLE